MQFLFHTVIEWAGKRVYYTIFLSAPQQYVAQLLDNPNQVTIASDFTFYFDGDWKSGARLDNRQLDILGEEIQSYYRQKSYF